jgi:hypothetical protein
MKPGIISQVSGRRIMANISAFQANDASSILAARTKHKQNEVLLFCYHSYMKVKKAVVIFGMLVFLASLIFPFVAAGPIALSICKNFELTGCNPYSVYFAIFGVCILFAIVGSVLMLITMIHSNKKTSRIKKS